MILIDALYQAELAPAALAALVAKLEQLVDLSRDTEIVRAEIDVQEQGRVFS